jgi:hypothetical protein
MISEKRWGDMKQNDRAELILFAENFHQQVIAECDVEEEEAFREDRFTEDFIDYLVEAGEVEDGITCYHSAPRLQLNGYGINSDQDCLYLFISLCKWGLPPAILEISEVENAFERLIKYFERAVDGYHLKLEEASQVFDSAQQIHLLCEKKQLTTVIFYLLTDGIANLEYDGPGEIKGVKATYDIWDIERLFRLCSSKKERESIDIDFLALTGEPIRCLTMPLQNTDYLTYMTILPADLLVKIYDQYGPKLLEKNVRTFLQIRGKVNKGIYSTILNEPHMFLAYNNGICITAEGVSTESASDNGVGISLIRDFQIVNGAQTVASLHRARHEDRASLDRILVPAKITVVESREKMEELVPKISEYSNSQNRISMADFSSNHPFHRAVEELSRTIWAPAAGEAQRQTRWFYERARGQYLDEKGRERDAARRKVFERIHLGRQVFTKTDLAKFENTWNQLPHIVSRGAQKNFQEFTLRLQQIGQFIPDQEYFRHLIAKAILFRKAERLVQAQEYGGYRANIVTYTLAWLSRKTGMKIDLDTIWENQDLSPVLSNTIVNISKYAHEHITNPPDGQNVTEWCKKEECWNSFKKVKIDLEDKFYNELSTEIQGTLGETREEDTRKVNEVMSIPSNTWLALSGWAKQTANLEGWQRSLVYKIGRYYVGRVKEPSRRQAIQALKALHEAEQLGFDRQSAT